MRNFGMPIVAALAIALPGAALAKGDYVVDAGHSSAEFSVRHLMIATVKGEFQKLEGTVKYDPAKPESIVIDATIDAASVNTREEKRDAHLKSDDFFYVEKHPNITFKSKSAKSKGKGKLDVTGDLTIRGVTKEVVLAVEGLDETIVDPWGNTRRAATATTKVNRKDFDLNWNQVLEAGGVMVGDNVDITVNVSLIKQAAKEETASK